MTSITTFSVAVASRIDKVLSYSSDELPNPSAEIPAGALVGVPLGKNLVTGLVLDQHSSPPEGTSHLKLRSIQYLLPNEVWLTKELTELLVWSARYYHLPLGKVLRTALPKAILERRFSGLNRASAWCANKSSDNKETIDQLARAPRQEALYRWVEQNQPCTNASIKTAGFNLSLLKQLREKELVAEQEHQHNSSPRTIERSHPLNTEQARALDHILKHGATSPLLVEGVTGSGKTEVYLQAAEKVLHTGLQVLILVPEIGLIPQTKARFEKRFSAYTYIYSSECSETEKLQAWCAARASEAAVFIGTRSAIFMPYEKLGLIVVDEEHDLSYKQQEGWRYHARDLATLRSRSLKVPLVLGSATPSLESFHNAQVGNYAQLPLQRRASGVALPHIQLLRKQTDQGYSISEESLAHIQRTLDKGSQVLVFINRRGYAPRVLCEHCSWIALCPQCDITLCKHMNPAQLWCHHCDYRLATPTKCPTCQSSQLSTQGLGSEQLTQHLEHWFPNVDCIRIDRDSTAKKGSFKQHMDKANLGDPCILIGTQMLAKGHHLPNLALAVISEADQALFSHDYRAKEHLAQLVTQVAGRTGRNQEQGQVLIETSFPDHPFWEQLIEHSYSNYAKEMLSERKENRLPPYVYSAFIRADSTDLKALIDFMTIAKQAIPHNQEKLEVLGPIPSAIEKKNRRFRYYLALSSAQRKILHENLSIISRRLTGLKGFNKVRFSIDVDPQTID